MLNKTAEEYRAEAKRHNERRTASIENHDTDGFVSQWASGINARLAQRKASIVEAGGVAEFWGLYDLEGRRVAAKLINGRYGQCWAICDDEGQFTGKFVSAFPKRESTMKRKGYVEKKELAPASARIKGNGTGLAGAASCRVVTFRIDGGYPEDAIVE